MQTVRGPWKDALYNKASFPLCILLYSNRLVQTCPYPCYHRPWSYSSPPQLSWWHVWLTAQCREPRTSEKVTLFTLKSEYITCIIAITFGESLSSIVSTVELAMEYTSQLSRRLGPMWWNNASACNIVFHQIMVGIKMMCNFHLSLHYIPLADERYLLHRVWPSLFYRLYKCQLKVKLSSTTKEIINNCCVM